MHGDVDFFDQRRAHSIVGGAAVGALQAVRCIERCQLRTTHVCTLRFLRRNWLQAPFCSPRGADGLPRFRRLSTAIYPLNYVVRLSATVAVTSMYVH